MVDKREDPPAEAGYWHGSATGLIAALRAALEPLAAIADAVDNMPGELKDDFGLLSLPGACLTIGHARAARAALNFGRPPTREELKAGGAKEVGALGLTHTDKDKL